MPLEARHTGLDPRPCTPQQCRRYSRLRASPCTGGDERGGARAAPGGGGRARGNRAPPVLFHIPRGGCDLPCFISQGEGVAGPLRVIGHDVRSFHPGQVRCLLQHGANPNHTNYMQQSALHLAAVRPHLPYISPISRLYLAYTSPISPLYLPYISPISPIYLPYISPISRRGARRTRLEPRPSRRRVRPQTTRHSPPGQPGRPAPHPGRPAAWPPLTRARLGCAAGRRTLNPNPNP